MAEVAEESLVGGTEHGILNISLHLFTCYFLYTALLAWYLQE
jgi:hypothetical protein